MLARAIVILINLGLLGLMGWGTFQQITTQQETNRVMADVHKNIRQAHRLDGRDQRTIETPGGDGGGCGSDERQTG